MKQVYIIYSTTVQSFKLNIDLLLHKLNQYKLIFMLRNNTLPPYLSTYITSSSTV